MRCLAYGRRRVSGGDATWPTPTWARPRHRKGRKPKPENDDAEPINVKPPRRAHFPSAGISMSSPGEDAKRQYGWERTRSTRLICTNLDT